MDSCNSGDHNAEDHIHKDITCNIGTVSNRSFGDLGRGCLIMFYWIIHCHDDMTDVSVSPDALGCMGHFRNLSALFFLRRTTFVTSRSFPE